jgi:M6 family metalloprotease-like protein
MKKISVIFVIAVLMGFFKMISAAPVNEQTARQIAVSFMNGQQGMQNRNVTPAQLTRVSWSYNHLYAFNLQDGGFVILSDDDRTRPVLAYSLTGEIYPDALPEPMAYQLQIFDNQLDAIVKGATPQIYHPQRNLRNVAPLITSTWKQSSVGGVSYNALCPVDPSLITMGGHTSVGCVALALAQVMRYWRWPQQGRGSNCYSYEGTYPCWRYDTLCVDFASTIYDWDNMPDVLTDTNAIEERLAVATLAYHCGVAMNMRYNSDCYGSSSCNVNNQYYAAVRHFCYSSEATVKERVNFSDETWINMLKEELDNQRPVLYCGQSLNDPDAGTYGAGHAFIFDGYDENDMFHVNWGWGGVCDSYFAVNSLIPVYYYNFSHSEQAIFNFHPAGTSAHGAFVEMLYNETLDTDHVQLNDMIHGQNELVNIGDTIADLYVAQAAYTNTDFSFVKWLDVQHLIIPVGDTLHYNFSATVDLPVGSYYSVMFQSDEPIDINSTTTEGTMEFLTNKQTQFDFWVTDTNRSALYNLAIFVRFADDEEIDHPFQDIDDMFNKEEPDYYSVYNYYKESTYDKIHFHTIYANQIYGGQIFSYVTRQPRGYYQPYSSTNPIGYQGELPFKGISMREAELIAEILHAVDSMGLVDTYTMLDGNGDGFIDNISFIVKGDVGAWATILWPHMEFFPQDSIDYPVTVNGIRPNAFNFEFEGAPQYFTTRTFCHEMGHSMGLPDLYHYVNYRNVSPAGAWDLMCSTYDYQQISTMLKAKYLHIADEPVQITEEGTYTLLSNASSASQNCYYIKSTIDSSQWFTFEYRNTADVFDAGIPATGLLIGRWNDTVPISYEGMFANAFFDFHTQAHQYWIFRPGSSCDTVNGDPHQAYFSLASGRTSFGPTTDPHPYLTDGTPELSFEITDIQEAGDYLTFHVHFLTDEVADIQTEQFSVYPNPAVHQVNVTGEDMVSVELYNALGQLIRTENPTTSTFCTMPLDNLSSGVYMLKIILNDGTASVRKFVKK